MVHQVFRDHLDFLETQALLAQLVLLESKDPKARQALTARLARKAIRAYEVQMADPEQPADQDQTDRMA